MCKNSVAVVEKTAQEKTEPAVLCRKMVWTVYCVQKIRTQDSNRINLSQFSALVRSNGLGSMSTNRSSLTAE